MPSLTHFDATTIRNEKQLATMVKERCSMPSEKAEADVAEWAKGKRF